MKFYLLICIAIFTLFSCKENTIEPTKPVKDIDDLVKNVTELPTPPLELSKSLISSKSETINEGGLNYNSQSKQYKLTNKFDEIIAFNSTFADVLYPGSIIQGKDIAEGKLSSIGNFPREPLTLTLVNGGSSKQISNPSLATVNDGIKEILKSSNVTPAQIEFSKTELYSTSQAMLELGIDANWLVGSVSGKFQKDNKKSKKSIVMFFKQIYYTIATEQKSNPSDYFGANTNVESLKQKVYSGNPPCIISSVNYGRIIMVKMTSEESYEKMKSTLEASWNGAISGNTGFNTESFNYNASFDAIIVGGSAKGATDAIVGGNIESINDLIQSEANFSPENPGFPISFTVRYLKDNSPVKLGKTTEYWEQDWKVDASQFQRFDFYFSHFNIIDDGNSFSDGKFFYKISILDKEGNILKTSTGVDAILETYSNNYVEVGSGSRLEIQKQLYGVSIPKLNGEQFLISIELFDYFNSGKVENAGKGGKIYSYPWDINNLPIDWFNLNLTSNDYETSISFRLVKQ